VDGGALEPLPSSADPLDLRPPDHERPLFFLHLPRTGGFTLKHLLQELHGARYTLLDLHKYERDRVDPSRYRVLEGHVGFRKARRMVGAPNMMTIVREPVARTVSVARHIRGFSSDPRFEVLRRTGVRPEVVFDELPELSNAQVKQLVSRLPRSAGEESDIDAARFVVDSIAVGLTERFEASLLLFAERFGLELPRFGVSNASPATGDDDLRSAAFREVAADRNALDLALHQHVARSFDQRVARYVELLRAMDLRGTAPTGQLRRKKTSIWDGLPLRRDIGEVPLSGWLLVDGRPADAVLAEAGAGWVPLLARRFATAAAGHAGTPDALYAGLSGTVPVAPDARELVVEAYDRRAGVRATHRIPIRRV
jgi:hypothetical protein